MRIDSAIRGLLKAQTLPYDLIVPAKSMTGDLHSPILSRNREGSDSDELEKDALSQTPEGICDIGS
jgi:hypothetical protein